MATELVDQWLHNRSPHTVRAYRSAVEQFQNFVQKPFAELTLADLQRFDDTLSGLAPASRARILSAVKSLLSFAERQGVLSKSPGAGLRLPKVKNVLPERILSEGQVLHLLDLTTDSRNHALLRLLYIGGLRVSELCALTWGSFREQDSGNVQLVVHGKGSKTRVVGLPPGLYAKLKALRGSGEDNAPVFPAVRGRSLNPAQVWRIVRDAARRAGLSEPVSPHWLRHAHASHSLQRGASIAVVKETLGHANVSTTSRYLHARPGDSSSHYLATD